MPDTECPVKQKGGNQGKSQVIKSPEQSAHNSRQYNQHNQVKIVNNNHLSIFTFQLSASNYCIKYLHFIHLQHIKNFVGTCQ